MVRPYRTGSREPIHYSCTTVRKHYVDIPKKKKKKTIRMQIFPRYFPFGKKSSPFNETCDSCAIVSTRKSNCVLEKKKKINNKPRTTNTVQT